MALWLLNGDPIQPLPPRGLPLQRPSILLPSRTPRALRRLHLQLVRIRSCIRAAHRPNDLLLPVSIPKSASHQVFPSMLLH